MGPARATPSRSRPARQRMALLVAVVLVASVIGCTPRMGWFEIINESDERLLLWGAQLAISPSTPSSSHIDPRGRQHVYFDDVRACFDRLELVTADLLLQATVTRTLCDGDRVTVRSEDLVPVRHPASVRNATSTDIVVTFEGGPGVEDVPLAPGERTRIVLIGATDGCSDHRLMVSAAGQRDTVTHHPGRVCAWDEWVVDHDVLAVGAARMTVVNETDLKFRMSTIGVPGDRAVRGPTLGPGQALEVDLGIARGGCLEDATIWAQTAGPRARDVLRASTSALCDGDTWTIAWEDVEALDPTLDRWVPGVSASVLASNQTEDSLVRLTVDGEDRAVLEPAQSERIWLGVGHDGCATREIAIWAHPDDGSAEPLIAVREVCDGDVLQVGASQGLHRAGEVITDPGS